MTAASQMKTQSGATAAAGAALYPNGLHNAEERNQIISFLTLPLLQYVSAHADIAA
jgi:hypothetical protein